MNIRTLIQEKKKGKKWAMLTAYDAPSAEILEAAGLDWLLVGDSLGMVVLGYDSTLPVTMDEMIHHAKAVRRGAKKAFVIGDLPYKGIERGSRHALASAQRFMKEAKCDAVKIEWTQECPQTVELLVKNKIPVMAHLGLTPQTAFQTGDFSVRGRQAHAAIDLLDKAILLEKKGVFGVLMECVSSELALAVTKRIKIPTVGIGSGPHCDAQVLVLSDVVGLYQKLNPRFVKRYANFANDLKKAALHYSSDVRSKKFPLKKNSYYMSPEERDIFEAELKGRRYV